MEEFRNKTISGLKWTYLSTFLARGLYPITIIFLARLLSPADFGLAGMALVVISLLQCFSDIGLYNSLVQQKGDIEKIANMALFVLMPLGLFWFLLVWISAPYVAQYFKSDEVIILLRTLGLIFLIQPLSDIPLAILLRDLQFKALFFRKLIPLLFSGVTSVTLAFFGFGAMSLIIGYLVGYAGTALIVWCVIDWRPSYDIDWALSKKMFSFGALVSMQSTLGWMMGRAGDLFVGRFLGAAGLGFYRMGNTYGRLPLELMGMPFFNVVYPIFCKIHRNLNEVGDKYLSYIRWISTISIPAGIAFVFVVPYVFPVLLGDKWLPAIPVLQYFAVNSIIGSIVGLNSEVYKAIGRPGIGVKFFTVRVLVSLPFYYYAAQQNIQMLAIAHLLLTCLFSPINIYICSQVLGVKYLGVFKQMKKGILIGGIFLMIGLIYNYLIGDQLIANDIINSICITLFYLVIGGFAFYKIDRKAFNEIYEIVRKTFTFYEKGVQL